MAEAKDYTDRAPLREASVRGKTGFFPSEAVVTHGLVFLSGTVVLSLRGAGREVAVEMLPDDADMVARMLAAGVDDYRKRGLM